MHASLCSFIIICLLVLPYTMQLTMDQMFPFGPENGDVSEFRNDDQYVQVNIKISFPFFGTGHNVLYVDTNGDLTFDNGYGTFTPTAFPLNDNVKMVATFWADVDTLNNPGLVYYRETTDPSLLAAGSAQIKNYFPDMVTYKATWMFITTWYNVTFYGGNTNTPTNTFQCALLTDGEYSYAIYNYLNITWTTGTASGGNMEGLGGVPAQVGFDAGDGINYYAIPESRTPEVVNMGSLSNLNPPLPGKYIFRINDIQIHNVPVVTIETCQAVTDPHFTTFDGAYYSPQEPPGPWFLASAPVTIPNGTLSWEVWFTTSYWYGNPSATCITQIEIDIDGQVILFGMNGFLRINGLDASAPWYYPNQENATFSVVNYGEFGYLLNTIDQVKVSFSGDNDNTLRIQAPLETYGNDTQGACGNMNGNPNDDPICPNGGSINACWQRNNYTTTKSIATTRRSYTTTLNIGLTNSSRQSTNPYETTSMAYTDRSTTENYELTTVNFNSTGCSPEMQQEIDQQCQVIVNVDGPFGICVTNASSIAENYYQACTYDLCINNTDSNVICYELQSYADACMQALPTVTIQWRSQNFCPPNCSSNAHYEDCAPSCPATCGNPQGPLTCPLPCRGACTCDQAYIYDNGKCILPEQCGCTDESGLYHQYGDSWVTSDCEQNCTCGNNNSITCITMTPCAPNATCKVLNGKQNCYCDVGYTGDGVDTCSPINYCSSNPCKNNATCVNTYMGHACNCPLGYSGADCATHLTTTRRLSTEHPTSLILQTTEQSTTFDCQDLPNGNYNDPNKPCAHYFYMCSNGLTYTFQCPANLVFNPITKDCDYPQNVPGCNGK